MNLKPTYQLNQKLRLCFLAALFAGVLGGILPHHTYGQAAAPLTNREFVSLVNQLPGSPEIKDTLIAEIRRRGIGFELTNGLRGLVATKSGSDALLRRTLEEAERKRVNPVVLPSKAEGLELLNRARAATLAATTGMPDFMVKQYVTRSYAYGTTKNWQPADRLTIAVSFRESAGEQYKLVAVNGLPTGAEERESSSYEQTNGTSSTGEFVSMLAALFSNESRTKFEMVDTDTLGQQQQRRAIIYDFMVEKPFSKQTIKAGSDATVVGYRGRVWIDRENYRVLRLESIATEIPGDFPVSAATNTIDYAWATVAERQYLLPSRAVVELTAKAKRDNTLYQSRNDIRFRDYRKYASDVKIIEDEVDDESPPTKP